jgi:hypothetical protein
MEKKTVLSAFIEKLRSNKRLEAGVYASILALAAVIFLLSGGISCSESTDRQPKGTEETQSLSVRTSLEARLEAILSSIKGAGEVRVMVTCAEEETGGGSYNLFAENSGTENVADGALPEVIGVIVVAEGAGDIRVKNELQTAVMTVLGTDAARISIFSMN